MRSMVWSSRSIRDVSRAEENQTIRQRVEVPDSGVVGGDFRKSELAGCWWAFLLCSRR